VTGARVSILTLLAMVAFAGNSLLCRLALKQTSIDAASFTFIRIASGALALWLIVRIRGSTPQKAGSWLSAAALFAYAAAFSFAYITLSAGTGALLLFGAVQATMIFWALRRGEQMDLRQRLGLVVALAGLVTLVFPGLSAPPLVGSILMIVAGIAWGVYSLRGKNAGQPTAATAGNFLRAVPMATVLSLVFLPWARMDRAGLGYAVLSGALASGVGYAIWYTALPGLRGTSAASVQLVVPVFAALGGILFLGELITLRFLFASVAVLGGIGLVVVARGQKSEIGGRTNFGSSGTR
jgi:drug/metabolite transporter (DMT)-like permease